MLDIIASPPRCSGDYGIGSEQLASMTRDHNFSALEQYGGVSHHECVFLVFKLAYP